MIILCLLLSFTFQQKTVEVNTLDKLYSIDYITTDKTISFDIKITPEEGTSPKLFILIGKDDYDVNLTENKAIQDIVNGVLNKFTPNKDLKLHAFVSTKAQIPLNTGVLNEVISFYFVNQKEFTLNTNFGDKTVGLQLKYEILNKNFSIRSEGNVSEDISTSSIFRIFEQKSLTLVNTNEDNNDIAFKIVR